MVTGIAKLPKQEERHMNPVYTNTLKLDAQHAGLAVQVFREAKKIPYIIAGIIIAGAIITEYTIFKEDINNYDYILPCGALLSSGLIPSWTAAAYFYFKFHILTGQTCTAKLYDDDLVYSIGKKQKRVPYGKIKSVFLANDIIIIIHRDMIIMDRTQFDEDSEKVFCAFLHGKNSLLHIYSGQLKYKFRKILWITTVGPVVLFSLVYLIEYLLLHFVFLPY